MTSAKQRELYILRHAKSDWESGVASDFERPLAKRGEKDAPAMGKWMRKQHLQTDYIISSPAERAKQTIHAVAKELDIARKNIHFNENIYLASVDTLLKELGHCPAHAKNVLLVGHNPGLDDLLQYLVPEQSLSLTESGKLMTTAALARLSMPKDWTGLKRHCAALISLTRPGDLKKS